MSTTMKSQRFFCALFVFGIGTLVDFSLSTNIYSKERLYKHGDIVLGGIFPFHLDKENESCSDLRSNILIYSEAMIYAVHDINKNGTILPNVTLGYDIRDTCGNDQEGVTVAADFVYQNTLKFDPRFIVRNTCLAQVTPSREQAPILAVIGGYDSRVSVNVANVLQVVDIPQISYGASSAELATSDFTSFFRTVPVDSFQSRAMVELVNHEQWTCVAVIGVDDWYGRSGVDSFVNAANGSEICIVMRQLFPVVDSEALIQQMITRLKNIKSVQIIILYSLVPQAVKVFEEALKQELTGITWIASDGWAESSIIQQARFKPIIQGAIGFGFHAFPFEDFKQHVVEATPLMQRGPWWNEFWEKEFNCSAANFSSPTHESCSGLERISPEKYEQDYSHGVSPYVRDAVYSVAYGLSDLLSCGAQRPSCSQSISALRPEDLLSSLKSLSFKGLTGEINFKKGQVEASYDIFNLQETPQGGYNLVKIGSWNAGKAPKLRIEDDKVQWHNYVKPRTTCAEICKPGTYKSSPNQCFWECIKCDLDTVTEQPGSTECTSCSKGFISNHNNSKCVEVPITYVEWGEPWGIGLSVLTASCILLTCVVLVIVVKERQTPIIHDTGGSLNVLLLVLVILSYAFNLIHLSKLSDGTCRAQPPVFYFIYTGGALVQFLKVYRIRVLVRPPTPPTPKHRDRTVLFTVTALWLLPFFVSLIWVIVDPPALEKHFVTRLEVYAFCKPYQAILGPVFRYFCAGYLGVVLITVAIVAYNTKELPHNHRFDEAKHLAFSLTVFAVTFATFFPGWSLLKGPSLTIFTCLTNLVAATGTVVCNFAPKLWLIYRFPHHNTQSHVRPAPEETRSVRSSTLLSIGRVAMALGTGERHGSPTGSPKRGSPSGSPISSLKRGPSRCPTISTPKRGSPAGGSPAGGSPARGSPAQGSPVLRGTARQPHQAKTYV